MIKNLLDDDDSSSEVVESKSSRRGQSGVFSLFDGSEEAEAVNRGAADIEPGAVTRPSVETDADAVRNTGLAWSAGIAFFGAVVFMLILGWGADVLLGTSPWGIVGGIVLGSVIGFVQFFRISSQIFKK